MSFLGAFLKLEKNNYSIHVCPSVHPQETFEFTLDGFSKKFCIGAFHQSIEEFKILLKSDKSE